MSRMTCRPRLPPSLRELWRTGRRRPSLQRGFAKGELRPLRRLIEASRGENGFIFVAAICLGLMVTSARGGRLDAPAAPTGVPNPRFSPVAASGAETNQVRDNLTGLIWARNANLASNSFISVNGSCTWSNAFNVITNGAGPVNGANYGGTSDWRLPNKRELASLIDDIKFSRVLLSGHPFTAVQLDGYWSSNAGVGVSDFAWFVDLDGGGYVSFGDKALTFYVWPVRGGQ